jgi:DNA-binding beta-propeller fold protein YncE
VGEDPYGLQYDPKSTLVYVENSCTDSVSVVNGTLGTIVRTLHPPAGVVSTGAVDDADNEIAVASYNAGGNLTFFNLTTGTTILTVPLGPLSLGIDALAFDAADDRFALAGGGPNLTFFSPSGTNRTVLLDEGTCLGGLEYVASTGAGDQSLLLTSDRCAAQVRALNATVFALDGTAITGRTASSLRSDPQTGDLYTSLSDGAGVAILNGSSLSEVGSVSGIVDPHFLAYDPADGTVWTACANSGNPQCLEGISQSTDEVTVSGKLPQNLYTAVDGLSWSSETGLLYVLAVTSPYYGGGYNVNTDLNLTPVDPASGDAYPNVTVVNFTGTIGSAHQPGLVSPTLAVPGTDLLVLADGNQNRVIGFNLSGLDTQWYTPVGGTPSALAYNATAGTIYVGVAGQDYLDVLSEATGALVRQIVTSFPSNGIVSDPINGRLYVSENLPSAANGLLQEFVGTGRSVENLTLRTDTSGVAFLPTTGTIAVAAPVSSGILIFGQALRAGPLTLQSSTAVQGEPATFTVVASEGYPPYSFNYTGVPGCTSTAGPTLTCAPTLAGIATLRVTVEDAAGETILEELPISVGPYPLSVGLSCTPSASHVLVNASAACSAVPNASEPVDVTDGLTFAWQIAPLLLVRLTNVTSAATQVEFLKAGNLTLTLIATFGNTSARASLSLEITGPATSGSPPGSSPPPGGNLTTVAVGIAVVAIVAVVAVLLVVRRRRSPPPGPATAPAAEPVRPSERLPTHEAPAVPAPATPSRDEDEHIYGG